MINPDAEDFDIFLEISKIKDYIDQSNKEKLEKEKEAEIKELKEKLKKQEAQIKESKNKNEQLKMFIFVPLKDKKGVSIVNAF